MPLGIRLIKYLSAVLPTLEAEDELRQRGMESGLTPDRYYNLLLQAGVDSSEAESARANYQLQQMQRTTKWQT